MNYANAYRIFVPLICLVLLNTLACSHSQHVKVTLPPKPSNPKLAIALNEQALIMLKHNQIENAISLLKRATAADPQSTRSFNNLGKVYYQEQFYSKAMAMFRQAVAINSSELSEPHNNLAMSYERVNIHELAIKHYTLAHEISPDNIQYTANLARALHRRGDRDEQLIKLLDTITTKDPRTNWQQWAQFQKTIILANKTKS